jgi:hypothetical protein
MARSTLPTADMLKPFMPVDGPSSADDPSPLADPLPSDPRLIVASRPVEPPSWNNPEIVRKLRLK